ncbi:MAG: DUF1624 domain-containing protein, partial [Leptospiraceae bacterium]|nr:DUF1624 domain-containing protein [Leptospiraceae bacterium]
MNTPSKRIIAIDITRGIAVLFMIIIHYIPEKGDGTFFGEFWSFIASFCYGKGAALFSLLAGYNWSLLNKKYKDKKEFFNFYFGRVIGLIVFGIIFYISIWPTEILTYFALYMLLSLPFYYVKNRIIYFSIFIILGAVPILNFYFGDFIQSDW